MRSWAQRTARWTANTVLLTVGLAGAGAALSGTAFAAGPVTSGNGGVLSGNQVVAPVSVPVNVCGNAVSAVGAAVAHCAGCAAVVKVPNGEGYFPRTSGDGSVASGNQVIAPVTVPVNVSGNALAILGVSAASAMSGSHAGWGITRVPLTCAGKPPVKVVPPGKCGCMDKHGKHVNGTPVAVTQGAAAGPAALPGAATAALPGALSPNAASGAVSNAASGATSVAPGVLSGVQGLPGLPALSGIAGHL